MSYWEKYLAGILDNIQVSIKNIHIRLEDRKESVIDEYVLIRGQYTTKKTKVYKNMCIGATIKEISLKTHQFDGEIIQDVDEEQNTEEKKEKSKGSYFFDRSYQKGKPVLRNLEVNELGLYIETDGDLISYHAESKEITKEQP